MSFVVFVTFPFPGKCSKNEAGLSKFESEKSLAAAKSISCKVFAGKAYWKSDRKLKLRRKKFPKNHQN